MRQRGAYFRSDECSKSTAKNLLIQVLGEWCHGKAQKAFFIFMDNQLIFKYSWETLPNKWVKKWKGSTYCDSNHSGVTLWPSILQRDSREPEVVLPLLVVPQAGLFLLPSEKGPDPANQARSEHCPTSLIGFLSVHHGVVGIKVAEHSNGEVHPAWHEPISDQTQSTLPYLERPSECLQRHQLVAFETFFIDREQARMGLGFQKDEYAKGKDLGLFCTRKQKKEGTPERGGTPERCMKETLESDYSRIARTDSTAPSHRVRRFRFFILVLGECLEFFVWLPGWDPSHSPDLTSAFLEYGMTRMGTMLARRGSQGTDIVDAENAMVVIPAPSWIDKCCPKQSSGACPEAKDGNERKQCVPISSLAPRVFDPKVCVFRWKQRGEGDGWRSLADQFG
ncbi:hypothetical protein L1987_24100 [Smallanthus sonchifolius]|uniref:Uncharacterized protein n=1 Tax=Smallanthus sonchifolius TaxID=185202 RepID=A0ACB9IJG7_9ASTR|nr:hypothetical protein L1987_24100 [Smallanthus sonchifolius]